MCETKTKTKDFWVRMHMPSKVRLENFRISALKSNILKKQYVEQSKAKKIMEKLNRAQKCSILGPQNLGSRGGGPVPCNGMIAPGFKFHQYLTFMWKRRLICHAGFQEVGSCHTRGEYQGTCNTYVSTKCK